MLRPIVPPRDHLGTRKANDEDRGIERLGEVGEEIERLVVGVMEIVEDEDERRAARSRLRPRTTRGRDRGVGSSIALPVRQVAGVRLEEALDDRATQEAHLVGIAAHGLDERRVHELELEQLAEEEADVADLAILEHGRDLRADLGLRRLGIHALDDAEARAENAREDVVRRAALTRRPAEDTRRRPLARALLGEEVAHEARLADPRGADERDRTRAALLANRLQRDVELAQLRGPPDEHRSTIDRTETRGGETQTLGHVKEGRRTRDPRGAASSIGLHTASAKRPLDTAAALPRSPRLGVATGASIHLTKAAARTGLERRLEHALHSVARARVPHHHHGLAVALGGWRRRAG